MTRQVILLRGVNVGGNKRVPMGELREALGGAGYADVATYVQSGNVVLSSERPVAEVERDTERVIRERFGLDIACVGRTAEEMAEVVALNPLRDLATVPKWHLVAFLGGEPDAGLEERLGAVALPGDRFAIVGRHVYTWAPEGPARSRLWWVPRAGVTVTARNWLTVLRLEEMARGG